MFLAPTRFKIYSSIITVNDSKTAAFDSKMSFLKKNLKMALKLLKKIRVYNLVWWAA
jgi:hypothetical protein